MMKRKRTETNGPVSRSAPDGNRQPLQPSTSSNSAAAQASTTPTPPIASSLLSAHMPKEMSDPSRVDIRSACFFVLTTSLYDLCGTYCRLANKPIAIPDLPMFSDWVTIASHPVCIKAAPTNSTAFPTRNFVVLEAKTLLLGACRRLPHIACPNGVIPKQFFVQVNADPLVLAHDEVEIPTSTLQSALRKAGIDYVRIQVDSNRGSFLDPAQWVDQFITRFDAKYRKPDSDPIPPNQFDIGLADPRPLPATAVPDRAWLAAQSLLAIKSEKVPETLPDDVDSSSEPDVANSPDDDVDSPIQTASRPAHRARKPPRAAPRPAVKPRPKAAPRRSSRIQTRRVRAK